MPLEPSSWQSCAAIGRLELVVWRPVAEAGQRKRWKEIEMEFDGKTLTAETVKVFAVPPPLRGAAAAASEVLNTRSW